MTIAWPSRALPLAALAVLATLMLLLAGCGSSDDDSSSASSGTTAATTASADAEPAANAEVPAGAPIVIGSVCSCTGPVSSSSGGVAATLKAWVEWTNANGGINGHPVKLVQMDDGLDAAKTVKQVKQLVEQHDVMAIVGEQSNLNALWADYVRDQGVPVIGGAVFSSVYETNPAFFPVGAQTPVQTYGALAEVDKLGKKKVAIMYCAESPTCKDNADSFEKLAGLFDGIEIVSSQRVTADAPNYTAPCLQARSSGADVMVPLAAPSVVTRITTACAQQGFKPAQIDTSFVPGPDWATDANMQGVVAVSPNQSLWDASIPSTKAFSDALAKYGDGVKDRPEFNAAMATSWAAAEAFKLAAERAEIGPDSTPKDVEKGLFSFEDETLDGLTAPLTFTKGEKRPPMIPCWFVSKIEDERWTAPNGAEPSCIPDDQRERVDALFAKS